MDPLSAAMCLALNLYHEARDQGHDGMLMVGEVTLNRVADPRFPDTVCGVVYDEKQFSWTHDGIPDVPDTRAYHDQQAWAAALNMAEGLLDDTVAPLGSGATHYHATSVSPYWADSLKVVGRVGEHIFYVWES